MVILEFNCQLNKIWQNIVRRIHESNSSFVIKREHINYLT
jgi:hypothetical protein